MTRLPPIWWLTLACALGCLVGTLAGCEAPVDDTAVLLDLEPGLHIVDATTSESGPLYVEVGFQAETWQRNVGDHGPLFLDDAPMTVTLCLDDKGGCMLLDYWDVVPSSSLPDVAPWGEPVVWVGPNGAELTLMAVR